MKSVTSLQIPYEKHHFRGLTEELKYEIDVWFQEKFLTNDALDKIDSYQEISINKKTS
jgi:hypothetical protein